MSEKKSKLQQKLSRLRVAEYYDKATDTTKVKFFFADKKTIKAYLKERILTTNKEVLPKEYKTFLKQVEAGRQRQATGVKIDGKFISDKFLAINHFEERAKLKGYKSAKELFANDKKDFDAAIKLYTNPKGFNNVFTSNTIIDAIDTFGGKFTINGNPATKRECILAIARLDSDLKRRFGSFFNEFTVNYTQGGAMMNLRIPDDSELDGEENDANLLDILEEMGIKVITSPKKKGEEEIKEENPTDKQGRPKQVYEYKVKSINEAGRRVTNKIKAVNKDAAIYKFMDKKPKNTLVNISGGGIKNKNVI